MRRSVFLKLLAVFLLVIGAATLTLNLTIRHAWEKSLRTAVQNSLLEKTRMFAQRVTSNTSLPLEQLVKETAAAGNVRATVIDRTGRVLADSEADPRQMENHAGRPEFAAALQGRAGMDTRPSRTLGISFLYVAVATPGGAVRLAYPLAVEQQTEAAIRRSLLVASTIALLVAMVLAALIAQLIALRLRRIVAFAERVAAGDLSARIAQNSTDEIAIVASALDRTARRVERSFSEVETSRRQLETLLNSMQEAVVATGADGRVLWVNGRMQRFSGGAVRVGSPVVETVRDPNFLAAIEGALHRKETSTTRATALLPGRIFQVTAAPMPLHSREAGGAPVNSSGAVAVLHDLTELERVEKTRRDFIANVSHELRTPLTSVQGYAETLLDSDAANDTNAREFLEIILKSAARMSRLTEDLLVLARVESGEQRFTFRQVPPAALLQDALDTFQVEACDRGLQLVVVDEAAQPVLADPEAIHQVLANLIRNAINYASEGRKIILGARPVDGMMEFRVSDFGRGIASEHLPRLFERFYRVDKARSRESGGTGLGLAIVKHIVLVHGGQVRAESRLGYGSTFFFTIPVVEEADS